MYGGNSDAKSLIQLGNRLLEQKSTLNTLWQEIAEQFYPERAYFTIKRDLSDEFASHLMNSYPVMARRDLADSFNSMLRRGKWFSIRAEHEELEDQAVKEWCDTAGDIQFRAMNDLRSNFKRATKMADNDYAAFGQAAIQLTLNRGGDRLLYRNHHLKDMAWIEDEEGKICQVHRNWSPRLDQLMEMFGKENLHQQLISQVDGDRTGTKKLREVNCRHVICKGESMPWCSVYLDLENEHIMESKEIKHQQYIIPRWAYSGSQYGHSPAVMVALPDARLVQAMTLTLLEAGERFVNPPMVATQDVIRSDVQLFAGGVTWADADYDERLGEVLRPLTQDKGAFPVGFEMAADIRHQIAEAFYLNRLTLPPLQGHDMTATEVRERVQEYIRQALPLFEPLEDEYNQAICDATFELMFDNGGFGPRENIPPNLLGSDVKFHFETPLKAAEESEKAANFEEAILMVERGMAVDQTLPANVDWHKAFREAMDGIGAPADWQLSESETADRVQQMQQMRAAQEAMAAAENVA